MASLSSRRHRSVEVHSSARHRGFTLDEVRGLVLLANEEFAQVRLFVVPVSLTLRGGPQRTSYRGVWTMPAQPCDRNYILSELSELEFELLRLHLTSCDLRVGDRL